MKKKKNFKNGNQIYIVIAILALIVFAWGVKEGKFQSKIEVNLTTIEILNSDNPQGMSTDCSLSLSPSSIFVGQSITGTIHDGINELCIIYFNTGGTWNELTRVRTNSLGEVSQTETINTVGSARLRAICGNCITNYVDLEVNKADDEDETSTHTCTDTDGGRIPNIPGTVTYDGVDKYTDRCVDSNTVYEYTCYGDEWGGGNMDCAAGETCLSSRSGGYCKARTWNPGDTVFEGSGSASTIGISSQISSIDLSDYGISTDGECRLGVQFSTSWDYANNKCIGIPGSQGVKWDLYDSNGLEYSRIDASPVGLGVDLHPESHIWNWDGQTKWIASMTPSPFPYPECSITYEWQARIYIYDCN